MSVAASASDVVTAIAEYIEKIGLRLAPLTAAAQKAIERLREYRSALISAAVTRKIDVRDCA